MNTVGMATQSPGKTDAGPPRLSRTESKARTRRRVLEAAETVFRRDGYHGASLEKVAAEAGFTKGAVYSNFDSKADLMLALLAARAERRRLTWIEAFTAAPNVEEFIAEVSRLSAAEVAAERDWLAVASEFMTVIGRDAELRARYAEQHEASLTALAAGIPAWAQKTGVRLAVAPERLATIVIALHRGLILEGLVAPERVPDELIADANLILLRGARADENEERGQ